MSPGRQLATPRAYQIPRDCGGERGEREIEGEGDRGREGEGERGREREREGEAVMSVTVVACPC